MTNTDKPYTWLAKRAISGDSLTAGEAEWIAANRELFDQLVNELLGVTK